MGLGTQTVSRLRSPLRHNSTVENQYLSKRAEEAAAKREASKAKRVAQEKFLKDIAEDIRVLPDHTVMKKWRISCIRLENIKGDILVSRYNKP